VTRRVVDSLEDVVVEGVHAAVDEPEVVVLGLLDDIDDVAVLYSDRTVAAGVLSFEHGDARVAGLRVGGIDRLDSGRVDETVAVHHQDRAVDDAACLEERVPATELFRLAHVRNRNATVCRAEVVLNAVPLVADDDDQFLDAGLNQRVEDVFEDRAVRGRQHGLWPVSRQRPEAGPLSSSEDHSRIDVHTCCRRRRGFNMAALLRLVGVYSPRMSRLWRGNRTSGASEITGSIKDLPVEDRSLLLAHPLAGDPTALRCQVHFGSFPEHAYDVEFDQPVEDFLGFLDVDADEVWDVERRHAGV
jgi:hypothetical protein